ncbi:MAG: phage major capsid protein, partial [Alphaproteobacteria bacterium]|nr:phage major capsid protein [Alphaproteobacteria bacterium]
AFAAQERAAFVSGDGVGKPKGFLASPVAADASQAWGTIGYLATGVAGGFAATAPVDRLIDLVFAPKAQYRQNGRFVMNRRTLAAVRKLKDQANNYVWQPRDAAGTSTVLGYPVTEVEDMPNIAADAFAIAFGDFQSGYLIVDRAGLRVLRDPYSAKPYVLFYVTKRVGGVVQNFDAIKLLKFGTA